MQQQFRLRFCVACAAVGLLASTSLAQLINSGFEADAVSGNPPVGGATGWTTFGPFAGTASDPLSPVRTGVGSLQLSGNGGFSVPGAFQTLPASAGQVWDFQGYGLSLTILPPDATFGLLKIVWSNGINDLPVGPGDVLIGQPGPAGNPGIEALPFVNNATPINTWQFMQARGTAPAGTTQVSFFVLFVDQSGGVTYFDDLAATLIPEPTSFALTGLGAAALLIFRRRK